ncbi:hypothetical protein BN134_336 [Cronobacter dublinensis 1210]|uniref:Uncharacterized protein n=1 Tax=Cronobacter dublinensis 1210 TaxID=1208656 RepID=A0ABM9Q2T7_9ENTR|nr:hypothetical protein BN134_336 [Cronobacter dublinensis 1210]
MTIIAVEKECLMQEMEAWRVPMNYVRAFTAKSTQTGGLIGLDLFFFNDTEHLISLATGWPYRRRSGVALTVRQKGGKRRLRLLLA